MKFAKFLNKKKIFAVALIISVTAILCFCFAGCSFSLSCANSSSSPFEGFEADYGTYTINSIDVTARVGDNSQVRFREEITVNFTRPKLGIYRDLATNSGESYRDIKIVRSEWSKVEHEDGFVRISLGKPDGSSRVTGKQKYIIEYTLIMPDRDNPDDIYLNLVGFGWTTKIEKANITLYTPALLGTRSFFTDYGSDRVSDIVNDDFTPTEENGAYRYDFTVENLSAFQGVTMRSSLPAGTISLYEKKFPWAEAIACIIFVTAGILLILYAEKGQEITEITNYYPPEIDGEKIIPPMAGLYIDGTFSQKDVASIIFYWASKGYIKIDNEDSDHPVLIKDLEISAQEAGGIEYLRLFDSVFSSGDRVAVSSLQYKLSARFNEIMAKGRKTAFKFYDKKTTLVSILSAVLSLVVALVITAFAGINAIGSADAINGLVPTVFFSAIGFISNTLLGRYRYKLKHYKIAAIAVTVLVTVLGGVGALGMFRDIMPLYASIPLCACTVFMVSVAALVRHRTESYIKALGDLLGFKNFLEVAEKDKLEMLLEENPQYYYDILPYANVLGVSDKWENKFKDITVQPPDYVVGRPDIWDLYVYSSVMRSINRDMCAAMSPKPSSSSKSGFGGFGGHGGGGFGGGGFGGGGGGAR